MQWRIKQCIQAMEELAPPSLALPWDNVGLHLGQPQGQLHTILVALTITEAVVAAAISNRVDLIVAHHPLIFQPLKAIRTDLPEGRILKQLIANDIAVFCSHTNLDRAPNGLNLWLAQDLQLDNHQVLEKDGLHPQAGLGRIGTIEPVTLGDLISSLETKWDTVIRFVGDVEKKCRKIAVCGGSGGDLVYPAWLEGAEVLISGEIGYHRGLEAAALGLTLIEAGHFATEKIMIAQVSAYLEAKLPGIKIIQAYDGDDPFRYKFMC